MRVTSSLARLATVATSLVLMSVGMSAPASAQLFNTSVTTVMTGLNNPRGLVFGTDGTLYVAEAGSGGPGPAGLTNPEGTGEVLFGATGAISRLQGGVQSQVVTGLPSLATQADNPNTPFNDAGSQAAGVHHIVFGSDGNLYGTIGLGGNQASRDELTNEGVDGNAFGQLVRFNLTNNTWENFADLTGFEESENPDGAQVDSNPYGLFAMLGGGFVATDAGGNSLLSIDADGNVSTITTFPALPNPLFPFGGENYDAVPTSVAMGPDGAFYVSQLTGFPFIPGAADIFRVATNPLGVTSLAAQFTNLVDLTFGPDGKIYALELAANGILAGDSGVLSQVDPLTGEKKIILNQGLTFPGGLTFGQDGAIYISTLSASPGIGQVIRVQFAAAPEPGAGALLAVGLFAIPFIARRRK